MIHRDEFPPKDNGKQWTFIKAPRREFIDKLDRQGKEIYIVHDSDGVVWVIYD